MIQRVRALELVYEALSQIDKIKKLDDKEKAKIHSNSDETEIFEVETEIRDKEGKVMSIGLHLKFMADFPLSFPKVYLDQKTYDKVKYVPHLDTDKYICSFNDSILPNVNLPAEMAIEAIKRAKRTLERGLKGENNEDFIEEYEAYWKNQYTTKDKVESIRIVNLADLKKPNSLKVIVLSQSLNKVEYFIHKDEERSKELKKKLDSWNIDWVEVATFYLGNLETLVVPPFSLTNRQVISVIQNLGDQVFKDFKKFINNLEYPKIVLFTKEFPNKEIKLFGWKHERPNCNRKGFRPGTLKAFTVLDSIESNFNVLRLTPQDYSPSRLLLRSNGPNVEEQLNLMFVGLGSVGSHLVSLFNNLQKVEYRLIDPDNLYLENLGRHWLGFDSINQPKVSAIKNRLEDMSPISIVSTRNDSVYNVFLKEPEFINDSDFIIVSIGESNIELWLAEQVSAGNINKPMFFVWVEPYLMGGHCIYIHPDSCYYNENFDEHGFFKFNIVDKEDYVNNNPILSLNEAGCHGFTPYSCVDLVTFLSSLFPKILEIIRSKSIDTHSFTWVGNKDFSASLGVKLSDYSQGLSSYTIIKNKYA